ncbi:MAG: aldehyde ferredoxin oxidoreductase family protein [Chloroflexota bacterium]|nr:aldehyde ferredoxin oxidoreductase family protein [Chloroflexota bacterium]
MTGGYIGKYCIVNLTTKDIKIIEPGEDFYKKYLTGYGLGAAVLMKHQKPGVDPLSAGNHLGLCSGLLTGAGAYFSGRTVVVGKSPLTGGWGEANVGGYLAREIKRAGYDAVFFTGMSEKPVWVYVNDEGIEIKDASAVWGKNTLETESLIKEELGDKKAQVACIGESGEKLSLISGIVTDAGRIAARSGLGAVMGSKRLKAVAFRGRQNIPVAHPPTLREIGQKYRSAYKESKTIDKLATRFSHLLARILCRLRVVFPARASTVKEVYRTYGTSGQTFYTAMVGGMPIKNWNGVGHIDYTAEGASKNSDESVLEYQKNKYACQNCLLACGGIIDIKKGRYQGEKGHKPEYETLGAFGGLLLHDNLDAIIELNEMCNRAGIDTISTGVTVAFAIECFEKGLIDENTTGGLKLAWGKSAEIIRLTEMIISREGFGDVLADGVKRAAEKIGQGAEQFAIHAGGQELPMSDARLDPGMVIAYQCEPAPGRHTISCDYYYNLFDVQKDFPAARRMLTQAQSKLAKDVRKYVMGSYYMQLINCAGICLMGTITSDLPLVEWLNAATGWSLSPDEYFKTGARILNLRKAFNVREGLLPEDSKITDRAIGKPPLTHGPLRGITIDSDSLLAEFYKTVGWDPATGGPTPEKMRELKIDDFV